MIKLQKLMNLVPQDKLLDICCGDGRHLEALHNLDLAKLHGIDLSPELLARARKRKFLKAHLVRADTRRLPFGTTFDVALNLFTSFGYFAAEDDNKRQLDEMARILRPGGRLVMDLPNRFWTERHLEPETRENRDGHYITQTRRLSGNRVHKTILVKTPRGEESEYYEDVRLYAPREIHDMARQSGLTNIAFYGSFDGTPFGESARRMILTAEKAA